MKPLNVNNKTSLHIIKDITSIEQLSKYNDLIFRHAKVLEIEGVDHQDVVQDMYIRLDKYLKKYPNNVVDGGFISMMIRNAMRNGINQINILKEKQQNVLDTFSLDESSLYTSPDKEEEYLDYMYEQELKYDLIKENLMNLTKYEHMLLTLSLTMPMTELSRETDIDYQTLMYSLNKIKKKMGFQKVNKQLLAKEEQMEEKIIQIKEHYKKQLNIK